MLPSGKGLHSVHQSIHCAESPPQCPTPKAFYDLQEALNSFMSLGRHAWLEARRTLTRLLSVHEGALRDNKKLLEAAVTPLVSLCQQVKTSSDTGACLNPVLV